MNCCLNGGIYPKLQYKLAAMNVFYIKLFVSFFADGLESCASCVVSTQPTVQLFTDFHTTLDV